MSAVTDRPNEDKWGQPSVAGKIKLSRRPESVSLDKEPEGQNGVRPKNSASRNSLNVPPSENKSESNSHRRESLKQNFHVAIARAEQSQHQADRSLAFIR